MNLHKQTIINPVWNIDENRYVHLFTFAFANREQYLEFRRQWKENYAALSVTLRQLKVQIRLTMQQRESAAALQKEMHRKKAEATLELALLKAAKLEAGRQYLAAKQATT